MRPTFSDCIGMLRAANWGGRRPSCKNDPRGVFPASPTSWSVGLWPIGKMIAAIEEARRDRYSAAASSGGAAM
jgi:hypothetical protein